MGCRSAGILPASPQKSGKQAKTPMFSIISCPAARLEAAPPEVMRCFFRRFRATSGGAASCRALEDGERKGRRIKEDKSAGGNREERSYKNLSNTAY